MIRGVIINNILDNAKLIRESASCFKAGFFDVIVKPVVNMIERKNLIIRDEEQPNT